MLNQEKMIEKKTDQVEMRQFLSHSPQTLKEPGKKYPSREGLYGR